LRKQNTLWLVEAKIVYHHNATQAVRAALAQLLEYRHYWYPGEKPTGLLALFSESVGPSHIDFLEDLGIASVWREGGRWTGSVSANAAELVPYGPSQ
jgi:hypothetical protein